MASQGKTKSKPVQKPQKTKSTTDTRKIVKAVIFGPTIAILCTTLLYFAWWGICKAFTMLHGVVTTKFVPWVGANWPIFVGVWALVSLTSILYSVYVQYQNLKKEKNNHPTQVENQKPVVKQDKKQHPVAKQPTEDISIDELIPQEDLEGLMNLFGNKKFQDENSENFISNGRK